MHTKSLSFWDLVGPSRWSRKRNCCSSITGTSKGGMDLLLCENGILQHSSTKSKQPKQKSHQPYMHSVHIIIIEGSSSLIVASPTFPFRALTCQSYMQVVSAYCQHRLLPCNACHNILYRSEILNEPISKFNLQL